MATKKKSSGMSKTGVGVALGAAALASAGAYFLYGSKNAKKNREKVRGWAVKAKGEVLEQVERVKELDLDQYKKIVDTVMARYQSAQGATARDVDRLGKELKGYWADLQKEHGRKRTSTAKKSTTARSRKKAS